MFQALVMIIFVIFGIALEVLLFAVLQPKRSCYNCGASLPKVRRPHSWHQMMRGGTTCECGAELDRRGNPRPDGTSVSHHAHT